MAPGVDCERHEREIDKLRGQVEELTGELARRESAVIGLQHDVKSLGDRVPTDLPHWMGRTSVTLENLARGQNDVVAALREGYVTVAELENVRQAQERFATKADLTTLRTELEPIRAAFWKAAGIIGGTIVLGLLGLMWELKRISPQ